MQFVDLDFLVNLVVQAVIPWPAGLVNFAYNFKPIEDLRKRLDRLWDSFTGKEVDLPLCFKHGYFWLGRGCFAGTGMCPHLLQIGTHDHVTISKRAALNPVWIISVNLPDGGRTKEEVVMS